MGLQGIFNVNCEEGEIHANVSAMEPRSPSKLKLFPTMGLTQYKRVLKIKCRRFSRGTDIVATCLFRI